MQIALILTVWRRFAIYFAKWRCSNQHILAPTKRRLQQIQICRRRRPKKKNNRTKTYAKKRMQRNYSIRKTLTMYRIFDLSQWCTLFTLWNERTTNDHFGHKHVHMFIKCLHSIPFAALFLLINIDQTEHVASDKWDNAWIVHCYLVN